MSPQEFAEIILKQHPTMEFFQRHIPLLKGGTNTKVWAFLPEHAKEFHGTPGYKRSMLCQYILSGGVVVKARDSLFGDIKASKPKPPPLWPVSSPFKIGDIISGDDRSYARSIYRFEGFEDGKGVLTWLAFDGHVMDPTENSAKYKTLVPRSYLDASHIATWKDIMEAVQGGRPRKMAVDTETSGLNGEMKIGVEIADAPEHINKKVNSEIMGLETFVCQLEGPKIIDHIEQIGVRPVDPYTGLTKKFSAPLQNPLTNSGRFDAECDCGAVKAGTMAHAHWCSTKQEIKS